MPKISICIPTHNTGQYLPEAIESVLQQEFADYELVICDNASTDDTPEICRRYRDGRLRYLRFEELTNQSGNFNRCLKEAKGEYVTLLHADDFLLPGYMVDRVKRLEGNESAGFAFGAVRIVDAIGVVTSINKRWPEDRVIGSGELLESLLLGCTVSPPSLMVRKACADRVGLFRTDLTWGHDWEWTLRLAEQWGACYASQPLAAYRVHAESGTAEQLNGAWNGYQEERILRTALTRTRVVSDGRFRKLSRHALRALSHRQMYYAEKALLGGRRQAARNNLWYAAKTDLRVVTRPTFWALLAASAGSANWYRRYRTVRDEMVSPQKTV